MRILVCGGRDFDDVARIYRALDHLHQTFGITFLIEGDARGADRIAGRWAKENGVEHHPEPADWDQYDNAAGPIRNKKMLTFDIEGVVAFPGGSGTRDMIKQSTNARLNVWQPYRTLVYEQYRKRNKPSNSRNRRNGKGR